MKSEPQIEPEVIIKRVKAHVHAHHGGAWKIAYADFVTAMMAFFMLLWIIGATNEDQRKGIADYFTPTIIQMKNSGGSNGILAGRSINDTEGNAPSSTKSGPRPVSVPGGGGGAIPATAPTEDRQRDPGRRRIADETRFRMVERMLESRLAGDPTLRGLKGQVRLVRVREGLRIDIIDRADFSMFGSGTTVLDPKAINLLRQVASAIADIPNRLIVRGHTDSAPFAAGPANNWSLSAARADATRRILAGAGIDERRFRRIEGVADTDPYNAEDRADPRNRRISIIVLNGES